MPLDGGAAPPWCFSFLKVDGLSTYYSYLDKTTVSLEIQKS
jgi:hypothetical protein